MDKGVHLKHYRDMELGVVPISSHTRRLIVYMVILILILAGMLLAQEYQTTAAYSDEIMTLNMLTESLVWYCYNHAGKMPMSMDQLVAAGLFEVRDGNVLMYRVDTARNRILWDESLPVPLEMWELRRFKITPGLTLNNLPKEDMNEALREKFLLIFPPDNSAIPLESYYKASSRIVIQYNFLNNRTHKPQETR